MTVQRDAVLQIDALLLGECIEWADVLVDAYVYVDEDHFADPKDAAAINAKVSAVAPLLQALFAGALYLGHTLRPRDSQP
jgi:hypothetical protein